MTERGGRWEARQRVSWAHRRLVNIETASPGARREVLTALMSRVVCGDVALAQTLGISSHTVRQHSRLAQRELGVGSRVELARLIEESDSRGRPAIE